MEEGGHYWPMRTKQLNNLIHERYLKTFVGLLFLNLHTTTVLKSKHGLLNKTQKTVYLNLQYSTVHCMGTVYCTQLIKTEHKILVISHTVQVQDSNR